MLCAEWVMPRPGVIGVACSQEKGSVPRERPLEPEGHRLLGQFWGWGDTRMLLLAPRCVMAGRGNQSLATVPAVTETGWGREQVTWR